MTIITRAKTHTYSNRNKKSMKKYRIKSKKGVSTYVTYIFKLSENKDVRQTKHTKVPVAPVIVSTRRRLEHSHFIQPEKMIIYKYRTQKNLDTKYDAQKTTICYNPQRPENRNIYAIESMYGLGSER